MAIEAKAKVQVTGGSEALKTIQGIQRATRAASAEATKAARESERASAKAAKETLRASREAQRQAQNAAREEQKKARDVERSAKRQADARIKEEHRAAREIARIQQREADRSRQLEQRTQRARERDTSNRARNALRFASAATAGVLAGGAVAAGTARGIAGVADISERVKRANSFQESLIITGRQAGVSKEKRDEIRNRVLAVAENRGVDPLELAGALETAQKQFNGFEKFAGIIDELAVTAKSSGSNIEDLTSALGYITQANNLTSTEDMVEALNLIVAAAAKGSVEVDNFARDFAASAGIFATNTGQTGIEGVRSFVGVAQGVATGGFGSAESATRVERFAADLQDLKVQNGLRGIGVQGIGKDGKIDLGVLLESLATNKKFSKASVRQGIFKEARSLQAVEALIAARNRVQIGTANAVDYATISAVNSSEGGKLTRDTFAELEQAGAIDMQRQAVRAQNEVIQNLKAYNDQILAVNKVSNELEKRLGTLALWLPAAGATGAAAGIAGMFAGGGGGGGGNGGGGILIGGFSPGAVAGLISAFAAGYGIAQSLGSDSWWEDADKFYSGDTSNTSRDVDKRPSTWLTDTLDAIASNVAGGTLLKDVTTLDRDPKGSSGKPKGDGSSIEDIARATLLKNVEMVNAVRDSTKAIKELADKVGSRPAPPLNQPARNGR